MPVLVDTNVLLDIATEDREWFEWSASRLSQAADRGGLAINPIIYAELSVHYDTLETLEAAVAGLALLTRDARRYRDYFPRLKLISPA